MTTTERARPPVAAVILAAGFSTRMGAFKPLLPFGSTTVIGRVVAETRAAGIDEVIIVTGHRSEDLAAALGGSDVRVVVNPTPERGMYSSVRTGIAAVDRRAAGALVLPVDVPLVRAATFAAVAAAGAASDAAVVIPTFRGERGHPPFFARRLFAEIEGTDPAGGLADLVAAHADETVELAVVDRGILHDMDHPADHARLVAALAHRRHPETEECEAILELAGTPEPVRRHCRAVAALAGEIADLLVAVGVAIDADLVRAAALLHDVAKGRPHHAEAGAEFVAALGFAEVAVPIARHMRLPDEASPRLDESAVVHLADKLVCEETRVGLDERFAPALRRFADDPEALAGVARRRAAAEAVLRAVEAVVDLPGEAAHPRPVPSSFRVEARIAR